MSNLTLLFVSGPDPLGFKHLHLEAALDTTGMAAGGTEALDPNWFPKAEGEWMRITKIHIGYRGTSGVQVTPIITYANSNAAIYLPTQVTQLMQIESLGPIVQSDLDWDCDVVVPLRGLKINTFLQIAGTGVQATDEAWAHVKAVIWEGGTGLMRLPTSPSPGGFAPGIEPSGAKGVVGRR